MVTQQPIPDEALNKIAEILDTEASGLLKLEPQALLDRLWMEVGEAREYFRGPGWYGGVSLYGALTYVGKDYASMGDFPMAIRYFERVLQEDPNREEARKDMVMALICLGFKEKDISYFERAQEFTPQDNAKYLIGVAYLYFGIATKRPEYLERALSLLKTKKRRFLGFL